MARLSSFWTIPVILLLSGMLPSPTSTSTAKTVASAAKTALATTPRFRNGTDGASLLAFKVGIIQDPTAVTSSWDERVHFCRWRGVVCGRRHPGRVVALELASVGLRGYISPAISNLTFLRRIDLSDNELYGELPQELGRLPRLRSLDLSSNLLSGEIAANLSRCLHLELLDLGGNQFTGRFPGEFGSLPRLVMMSVHGNHVTGTIPPSLGNLSSLYALNFGDNNLTGGIPGELGRLKGLVYLSVEENMLSGEVPASIYNLSRLGAFVVAFNNLSGAIPSDIGIRLPRLDTLLISYNLFEGPIPSSLPNASSLITIHLRRNRLSGTIPSNFGGLTFLRRFVIGENRFVATEPAHWDFLTSLTNCTRLRELSVWRNQLGGALPNSIGNFSVNLGYLGTGSNLITGSIPEGITNLRGLDGLSMAENLLTGNIPATLGKLEKLVTLNLQSNGLLGEIPAGLGNISSLERLALGGNRLVGTIPKSFGNYRHLRELNLSSNSLSGTMPDELSNLFTVTFIYLQDNSLVGTLPSEWGRLKNLEILNISGNKLSGAVPSSIIGGWQSMQQLSLAGNLFNGTIPLALGDSRVLETLDLSHNNFTGSIPQRLGALKFLYRLDLSFNDLEGQVPRYGVFTNVSRVSLIGNRRLCEGITALKLPACPTDRLVGKKRSSRRSHLLKFLIPVVPLLIIFLLLCAGVYLKRTKKSNKHPAAETTEDRYKKISYNELVSATDGFSPNNLIGTGSFGSVYKGVLNGLDRPVAIKVLNLQRRGAPKSFVAECEALRNARHRNLVKIITACSSIDSAGNDFKALVFDYMPNGSLDEWLHPAEREAVTAATQALDFQQRLSIAIDVASALDYLHSRCHSPIIHCDLKPSNVLLDEDMTAHVGDFGLARFLSEIFIEKSQSSTVGIKGTVGYIAPEYGVGGPVSTAGDVYSFGILLLELFTGKRPVHDMFKAGVSLRSFVEAALADGSVEVMGPALTPQLGDGPATMASLSHFVSLMRIGLRCSEQSARQRMEMGDVLSQLQAIERGLTSQ